MSAKPEVQALLDLINSTDAVPPSELTPAEIRHAYANLCVQPGEAVASVEDHVVVDGVNGSFMVRLYRPTGSTAAMRLPVLIWFHGGGFVIGSLETADSTVRALANAANVAVVSVDYHLAPEHPFPAAVDDAVAALGWVVEHADELGVDPDRLAVGGDSAGGNLAAVASQIAKAAKRPKIQFQLLVYPVTDLIGDYPSMVENAEGKLLTAEMLSWFAWQYLGGRDRSNPRVSPLLASDLSGLPPALVITAELDPLRDEGEAYAAALAEAGVPTQLVHYEGQIHNFFGLDFLPESTEARALAAQALRTALDDTN